MGLAPASAQVFQTNLVMKLSVAGTANVQTSDGVVTKTRIATKDLLNKVGTAQGLTLDKKAKLIFELPQGISDDTVSLGPPVVSLQNGTDIIALGDNFNLFQADGTATATSTKGRSETDYGIWRVSFDADNVSFEAQGFTTFTKSIGSHAVGSAKINFAGDGTVDGNPAVFTGVVGASGNTLESVEVQ